MPRNPRSAEPGGLLLAVSVPLATSFAMALAACAPVGTGVAADKSSREGPVPPRPAVSTASASTRTASPSSPNPPTAQPDPAAPPAAARPSTTPTPTYQLVVTAAGTAAQALAAAGRQVPGGLLLNVVTHQPLGPDGIPGKVLRGKLALAQGDPVSAGDLLTIEPGTDRTEPLQTQTEPVPGGWPRGLYAGGTAGTARVVRGSVSGALVSVQLLTAPTPGRLIRPATVHLTFDDGPDPTWTPQVLALLEANHVHAVFCQIGQHAAAHPGLVRAVLAAGDQLCDHTWDHDELLPTRPVATISADIARGRQAIATAAGGAAAVPYFRAPGGAWSPEVVTQAGVQHMTPLYWTVDPRDWSRPGTQQILATIWRQLRPGGTILLHDGGGDRSQTLAALALLLPQLRTTGYIPVLPTHPTPPSTPSPGR